MRFGAMRMVGVSLLVLIVQFHFSQARVFKLKDRLSGCGPERCPETVPGIINVHLVPHSHDDTGWLKTVDQYFYGDKNEIQRAGVQYILESVVKELAMDPTKKFIQVETGFLWRWWNDKDDFMKNLTMTVVNSGQLEFAGGGWSMNDEAATHFASIIDNMELGLNWLKETLGDCATPKVAWQIDPFGHSKEQARLFAEMGFDSLFFARIDFRDKENRKKEKELQMIWNGGKESNGSQTSIFTGVFDNHYSAPQGFCWDVLCTDEPLNDDPSLEEYNKDDVVKRFVEYVNKVTGYYKNQEHIMVVMGDDFHYQNARMNYKNIDKLIKHMNEKTAETGIKLFYSSPDCYVRSLNKGSETYSVKEDDFFPYASSPGTYWTGYFTSRPTIKLQERLGARDLNVAKQLELAGTKSKTVETFNLQRAMGLMQHHDAVTGTEKQLVAWDYSKRLYKAVEESQRQNIDVMIQKSGLEGALPDLSQVTCTNLNISQCEITEKNDNFILFVYNAASRPISPYIRIPVPSPNYTIHRSDGFQITVQAVPVPDHVKSIPGRNSSAEYELVARVFDIPAMGFTSLFVSKGQTTELKENVPIEMLHSHPHGSLEKYSAKLEYYQGSTGLNKRSTSGAYIFSPDDTGRHDLGPVKTQTISGELVNETITSFGTWGVTTLRSYLGLEYDELIWQVGPIPIDDGIGKEVVIRYATDVPSEGRFYTDSNGRQIMERVRKDPDGETDVFESKNYYPITTRLELRSSGGLNFTILTDRSQGGTSLEDGVLELMLHRRLLHDDHFGVGEALNELEEGEGLVARGRHWVLYQDLKQAQILTEESVLPPQLTFLPTSWDLNQWLSSQIMDYTILNKELPEGIQVLRLSVVDSSHVLVRIYNALQDAEGGQPTTLDIQDLFAEFNILSMTRMTLGGDRPLDQADRLAWKANDSMDWRSEASGTAAEATRRTAENLEVVVQAEEIQTYLLQVDWN